MTTFALTDEHARLGKISNNLEKHGEEELITGFTLPLELRIPRPHLVGLMGTDFDASAWKADSTPADWLRRVLPMELTGEVYVGVQAALVLAEDLAELTFEDCRVTHVTLAALAPGGITHVSCHLYLRPGIGDANLLLQEYQGKEIAVQLTSGKLRVKADKAQQQLPLGAPPAKTERELAFERGEEVQVITTVIDEIVTHEHPSFNGGTIVHSADAACMVCEVTPVATAPETLDEALAIDEQEQQEAEIEHVIGTPEEERDNAHAREREIAEALEDAHANGDGPGDERKPPKRAPRRAMSGDAVN